jgi:hypothetical protein
MSSLATDPPRWLEVEPRQPWAWQAGELEPVPLDDPAAGADWSYTPQGGRWEQVELVHARLVTSAQAANRVPVLTLKDQAGRVLYEQPVLVNQTATLTQDYSFARELHTTLALLSAKTAIPMPRFILRPQWTLSVVTAALDVADQWSRVALVVTRFSDAEPAGRRS